MTARPMPAVFHPDHASPSPVLRDAPASDFIAMMERSGANPDFVNSLRTDW